MFVLKAIYRVLRLCHYCMLLFWIVACCCQMLLVVVKTNKTGDVSDDALLQEYAIGEGLQIST